MKTKTYIFGDPAIRAKVHEDEIREGLRFILKCIDWAFACIGFAALLTVYCQICAW